MQAEINVFSILSAGDWMVFAGVLLLTLGLVIYGNFRRIRVEKGHSHEADLLDLLLMGRRLTLPLFTATLVATWYGGIFSVTQYSYETGIYNWLTQGVFWYAAYLIFAFCLVGRIRRSEARTMPELLRGMFGPRSEKLGAWLNLLNLLPITYVMALGLFLQVLFGGSLLVWMVIGTAMVVAYSTFGGLRSVVYSDLVQFVVMCASVAMVIFFSMRSYGGLGWLRAHPAIPAGHWKLMGEGMPLSTTLVWGFLALGTLVDPNFYQRCLAAKDVRTARRGILLATGVWVAFDFCTTFGALYARAVLPEADSLTAYLVYSVQLLPAGYRGFFLAGILATILSTLDSYLFLSGTLASFDLAPSRLKGRISLHYLGTIGMAVLAVIGAVVFERSGENLVEIWKFFGGYASACLLFPLMAGYLLPGRVSDASFSRSCICGMALMTLFYLTRSKLPDAWSGYEPFYYGLLGSLAPLILAQGARPLRQAGGSSSGSM